MNFGPIDWYKTLGKESGHAAARRLLELPGRRGGRIGQSGRHRLCPAILIRGRQPILFNKLQFASIAGKKPLLSNWNCRPRNLAHLCAWIGQMFETNVNWQVINTKVPVSEWHDAPILYISGSQEPKLHAPGDRETPPVRAAGRHDLQLRECSSEEGNSPFGKGARKAYAKIFPDNELVALDPSHDIYSKKVGFDLQGRPKFSMVTNNVRPLAIHVDEDLPRYGQASQVSTKRNAFEAASNVFMYITDQGVLPAAPATHGRRSLSLRPRTTGPFPRARSTWRRGRRNHRNPEDRSPEMERKLEPEPLALERFSRLLAAQTGHPTDRGGPGGHHGTSPRLAPISRFQRPGEFPGHPRSVGRADGLCPERRER